MGFWIERTKLPLIKVSEPFLHKMPVLANFSDFFPDYIEEMLGITNYVSPIDSNTHPQADTYPHIKTLSKKTVHSHKQLKMDTKGTAPLKKNC